MATQSGILAWRIPQTVSLVGYSPWGHKESDTTEQLTLPSKCCVTLGHESPLSGPQFHPLKNAHLGWTLFQVVQLQLL